METRISGSLDAPRLGGLQPAKFDTDTKAGSVSSLVKVSSAVKQDSLSEATSVAAGAAQAILRDAVVEMKEFVQSVNRDIDFMLDDDSGRVVVNITDRETGSVIRQIPSEEALRLAESLSEARSLLFKTEA